MIFKLKENNTYSLVSIPLNKKTVYKKCRGSNSTACIVKIIPIKLKTRLLYTTQLFVDENHVEVTVEFKRFPYIFNKHDYNKEYTDYDPLLEDGEWEFCQELRKDLRNRESVIIEDGGRVFMARNVY